MTNVKEIQNETLPFTGDLATLLLGGPSLSSPALFLGALELELLSGGCNENKTILY